MGQYVGSSITASVFQTGFSENRTVEWSLTENEIEEVRLQKDEETIARD